MLSGVVMRGSAVSDTAGKLSHKFVGQVEQIFKRLAKPLEWRSFYVHDLNLLVETDQKKPVEGRRLKDENRRSERDGLRWAVGGGQSAYGKDEELRTGGQNAVWSDKEVVQ